MKKINRQREQKGFVLIEIIIAIALFLLIISIAAPMIISFFRMRGFEERSDRVIGATLTAREQATFRKEVWGVKFLPTEYTLFKGISYAAREQARDERFALRAPMTVNQSEYSNEIVFSTSGVPLNAPATVKITEGLFSRIVLFNEYGAVIEGPQSAVGPRGGGTFSGGGAGSIWTSPENAALQDAIYTGADLGPDSSTQDLQARNFGFSIPSTATINGIEFVVRLKTDGTTKDQSVKFVKAGTAVGTDFSRGPGVNWPITDTDITFGGPTQLAGVSWTPADINNTDFGINISALGAAIGTAYIDYISAKVYYTTASASVYDALRGFPRQIMNIFFK